MEFSSRNGQIIHFMLESDRPLHSQEIAEKLGISTRTVQRVLPFLKKTVQKYGIMLVRSRKEGSYLSGTPTAKDRLSAALSQDSGIDPGDREERQRYLLFSLLKEREPRKIFSFSQLLGVSESTIAGDIEAIRPWLAKNHLEVVKKKGYGVFLRGQEQDYREAMRRFIEENISIDDKEAAKLNGNAFSDALMNTADSSIYSFLDKDVLQRVNSVLQGMNEPRLNEIAENAYAGLATHIAIAIERIRKGGFLEVSDDYLDGLEDWEDYDLAVRILSHMEKEFDIEIPREEISYVLLHIQGSKLAYSNDAAYKNDPDLDENDLLDIIDRMIDCYDPALAPRLKSDEDFVRGLMVHLRPVFVRLKENMNIYNPILSDIQNEYPDIFAKCASAAKEIEKTIGVSVSDEEIGFLAMHFGAADERIREQQNAARKVTIGIVCASGFGVARLMMTRLEKFLSDKAYLKAYGRDELASSLVRDADFFVSTMNLDPYGVDYLLVSPLITGSDLSAIEHKMKDYSILHRDAPHADFLTQLKRIGFISTEISSLLEHYRSYQVAANISFRELLLFLGLKITGNTALASEVAQAVTEREKLYSQLFPELSLGLLHCRTKAVDQAVFVSCTPKDSDHFSDPFFKGIRAVVMMLSPDDAHRSEHGEVLGSISAAFINNEQFLSAICSGKEEEIRTELTGELKKFYFDSVRKIM